MHTEHTGTCRQNTAKIMKLIFFLEEKVCFGLMPMETVVNGHLSCFFEHGGTEDSSWDRVVEEACSLHGG